MGSPVDMDNLSAKKMYLNRADGSSLLSIQTASSSGAGSSSSSNSTDSVDYSALDRFGFIVVAPGDDPTSERKRNVLEARRALKWVKMLRVLEGSNKSYHEHHKFEKRILKGIPDCLRNKLWSSFVLCDVKRPIPFSYKDLYLKISGFERQIDLDIERTLRDHVLFRCRFSQKQVSLFKILVAYSNYDPAVGYCQGMSTVGAFLLMYFDEELAFSMLVRMLQRDQMRLLYMTGFKMLFESFHIQERLMLKYIPLVHAKLASYNITTSIYATKWYLTLFLGFPFQLATKLWDLFLYYGFDMLIVISVALLKYFEQKILALDYEPCMQFISRLAEAPIDEKAFLAIVRRIWKRVAPDTKSYMEQRLVQDQKPIPISADHSDIEPVTIFKKEPPKKNEPL